MESPPMNYNVKLTLWYGALETSSSSLRGGGVLSAYIHLRTGNYRAVGFAQGVQGISELAAALPAGFAADRYRRDAVLRVASGVGAVAALTFASVLLDWLPEAAIVVAMALLGTYAGCYLPVLESVFAESLERGNTKMFTLRFMVQRVSSCAGPAIAVAFFLLLGNEWSEGACERVLLAGLALMAAPLLLLWAFDDDRSLHHRRRQRRRRGEGGHQQGGQQQQQQQQRGEAVVAGAAAEDGLDAAVGACAGAGPKIACREGQGGSDPDGAGAYAPLPDASPAAPPNGGAHGDAEAAGAAALSAAAHDHHNEQHHHRSHSSSRRRRCRCCCGVGSWGISNGAAIAALITTSDIIGALAAGMTVRFFALFFMRRCEMDPASVALLSFFAPLAIAAFSAGCQRLSRRFGRIAIPLATRMVDVVLLLCMALVPFPASARGRALLACLHLARTGIANCARPLLRSLLQDHLPDAHRAKVSALDSVKTMGWSGSAALGGVLIERFGFEATFVITAGVKLLGFLPLAALLLLVREGSGGGGGGSSGGVGSGNSSVRRCGKERDGLTAPLLFEGGEHQGGAAGGVAGGGAVVVPMHATAVMERSGSGSSSGSGDSSARHLDNNAVPISAAVAAER